MSKKTPMTSSEYKSRWRKKHPLTDKAIQKKYYENHKEQTYSRVLRFRLFKNECNPLMNIQIE